MISEAALKKAVTGRRVLIDSNIIIYLTDNVKPYAPLARALFDRVEAGKSEAVISILSVSEVMQGPLRRGYTQNAVAVRDYLVNFPNCRCQEISLSVLAEIGTSPDINWKGLRTVDSLIIACGLINGVDLFVSNDTHFKKSLPRKMLLSFD